MMPAAPVQANPTLPGQRPKLLFLAWSFPPVQVVASVRSWNIAKYLARLGWDVTVVTPRPEVWRRLDPSARTDIASEGVRQIFTGHDWRCLAPTHLTCWNEGVGWVAGGIARRIADRVGVDYGMGWIKPAERACRHLTPGDVDLVLASGPPFATFMLAQRLARRLGRPYVLDYRDHWTEPGVIQDRLHGTAKIESGLLAGASAVTAVSQSWAGDLAARYSLGSRVHVVTNGYDPEDLARIKPHDFGHFAIVYAGVFYPPERVITPLLAALQRLHGKPGLPEWYFHYYGAQGDHENHVRDVAARLGLSERVRLHGRVPRAEALEAVRGANVAAVIGSVDEHASLRVRGTVPAKVFEMLGMETPILLIGPPDTDIEWIASAGFARRFSGGDIDGIASFLEALMTGRLFPDEKKKGSPFAWQRIADTLDTILRQQLPQSRVEGVLS